MNKCPFCGVSDAIEENRFAFALYDGHPLSRGHTLIIPKRHIGDLSQASTRELFACFSLLQECQQTLDRSYSPDGYNIGINCGASAGQTVPHLHIHLIPRYAQEEWLPKGGVRGLVRIYGGIHNDFEQTAASAASTA